MNYQRFYFSPSHTHDLLLRSNNCIKLLSVTAAALIFRLISSGDTPAFVAIVIASTRVSTRLRAAVTGISSLFLLLRILVILLLLVEFNLHVIKHVADFLRDLAHQIRALEQTRHRGGKATDFADFPMRFLLSDFSVAVLFFFFDGLCGHV
jgi:hypothetical protein